MSVKMTYSQVRRAFLALNTLVGGNLSDGEGAYVPELPFKVVLKIKRMIGVLSPLIEDLSSEERKLAARFPDWNGQFATATKEISDQLLELHSVECRVGTDLLTEKDFSHLNEVPVTFAGILSDIGPLFLDEEEAPVAVELPVAADASVESA